VPAPDAHPVPVGAIDMDPQTLRVWLAEARAILIDVREPDEHAAEWIRGSRSFPLSCLDPRAIPTSDGARIVLHCKGGKRSLEAAARLIAAGHRDIANLKGGIDAWKSAGLPVERNPNAPRLPIMRQVQLVVGSLVVAGTAMGAFVSPWFLIVPALLGSGLAFAGASGTCGLAISLSFMPWNKALRTAAAPPAAGKCCSTTTTNLTNPPQTMSHQSRV
jgi:rhodanese-related sulfurtransferase